MDGPYRTPGKEMPRTPLAERAIRSHDHYWKRCKAFCKDKAAVVKDEYDRQIMGLAERGELEGQVTVPPEVRNSPYYRTKVFCEYLDLVFEHDFPAPTGIKFYNYSCSSLKFVITRGKEVEEKRLISEAIMSLTRGMD